MCPRYLTQKFLEKPMLLLVDPPRVFRVEPPAVSLSGWRGEGRLEGVACRCCWKVDTPSSLVPLSGSGGFGVLLGLRWKRGDLFCVVRVEDDKVLMVAASDWLDGLDWLDGSRKLRKEGKGEDWEVGGAEVVVVVGVGETLGILGKWLPLSLALGSISFFTHDRIFSLSSLHVGHMTVT